MSADPTVFLSAGEASGDQHGAELARELRRRIPGVRLLGLGGHEMAAAGVDLLAGLDRLAVLGFVEVVRHLPDLARLERRVRTVLTRGDVDLFVPIDYPGLNLRLAGAAHEAGLAVLYYIAPQVWAWRESRARRLACIADEVCVVLPFEEEFLARHGVRARFVGHPLLDRASPGSASRPTDGASRVLGLFPGSRVQEVRRLLPVFLAAASLVRERHPEIELRVARSPELPPELFADCAPGEVCSPDTVGADATAAITKSGTITLQLALADLPMVVGYRVSPLTFALARRIVRVPHISLVNLVAGREVVPEFVQGDLVPEALASAVLPLLEIGSEERQRLRSGLAQVRSALGEPGAAGRVADACVRLLAARRGRSA